MLERLADYDDRLMEELISDIEPSRDKVFEDMVRELRSGHVGARDDRLGRAGQRRDAPAQGAAP